VKWWAIKCSSRVCRWSSVRKAATREDAERWSCPRCGEPVMATVSNAMLMSNRNDG
jgi:predicted RNA-binding Zn-ribbon protein involved in translation (DUF1610 family)